MSRSQPAGNHTVFHPLPFLEDVIHEAKTANKRFYAQAMEVQSGPITDRLFDALSDAAQRGIDTRLHVDWYTFLIDEDAFYYMPFPPDKLRSRPARMRKKRRALDELAKKGVKVNYINPPSLLNRIIPTRGRNHMKMVIVDDNAWVGGVNFHDTNFAYVDLMVKFSHKEVTDEITALFEKIGTQKPFDNFQKSLEQATTLLVDSGQTLHSLILDEAVRLVTKAEKNVRMTTVFYPDGRIAAALNAAYKRGVAVEVITPHLRDVHGYARGVSTLSMLGILFKRKPFPVLFYPKVVHAKLLLVDDKVALFGSHNFSSKGVAVKTSELAIHTSNTTLVDNLRSYYDEIRLALSAK